MACEVSYQGYGVGEGVGGEGVGRKIGRNVIRGDNMEEEEEKDDR